MTYLTLKRELTECAARMKTYLTVKPETVVGEMISVCAVSLISVCVCSVTDLCVCVRCHGFLCVCAVSLISLCVCGVTDFSVWVRCH